VHCNVSNCPNIWHYVCRLNRILRSSNDGTLLAIGGTAGVLRIWDYSTRSQLSSQKIHSAQINSVAFSCDDKQVVSVGDDGSIVVWYVF
jgi:WD40 repeat protein